MHNSLVHKVELLMKREEVTAKDWKVLGDNVLKVEDGLVQLNLDLAGTLDLLDIHEKRLKKVEKKETNLFNAVEFLSLVEKVHGQASIFMRKLSNIYTDGKSNMLSPHAIQPGHIRDTIQKIDFQTSSLDPIFKARVGGYYSHKLTRVSWAGTRLHVTLQIPLIDSNEGFHLHVLNHQEKASSEVDLTDYSVKAYNTRTNGFMYLTQNDLRKCMHLEDNRLICLKRKIEIRSHNLVVYEINPTSLLFNLGNLSTSISARMRCHSSNSDSDTIITTQIFFLATSCSLVHPDFYVSSLRDRQPYHIQYTQDDVNVQLKQAKYLQGRNFSKNLSNLQNSVARQTESLRKLENDTKKIAEKSRLTSLDLSDFKRTSIIYGSSITGSGLILFIASFCALLCLRNSIKLVKGN